MGAGPGARCRSSGGDGYRCVALLQKCRPVQNDGWWPWAPFGWFFFIPLLFVGFFVLRFFLWGWWGGRGWYYGEDPATQVLMERFARGEITKAQFEQMRKDLQG